MKSFWDYRQKNLNEVVKNVFNILSEATLAGSGKDFVRHSDKYVGTTDDYTKSGGTNNNPTSRTILTLKNKVHAGEATSKDVVTSPLRIQKNMTTEKGEELPGGAFAVPHKSPGTKGGEKGNHGSSLFHVYDKEGNKIKGPERDGTHRIEHNKIRKGSHHSAKYNYEVAVTRVYNHYVKRYHKTGKMPNTVDDIKNEIEAAKSDKSHPLNMSHAKEEHFAGGLPKDKKDELYKKAVESHYDALDEVASTIHSMLHHPDFKTNREQGHILVPSGTASSQASPLAYKVHKGEPNKKSLTSKADTFTFQENGKDLERKDHKGAKIVQGEPTQAKASRRISLKKEIAQIHSNYGTDSEIVMRASANQYFGKHIHDTNYNETPRDVGGNPIDGPVKIKQTKELLSKSWPKKGTTAEFDHVSNLISHLRSHMDNSNRDSASAIMEHLHNNLPRKSETEPGITRLVYKNAATGEGKFDSHVGTATHMGETGKYGDVHRIDEYLDLAEHSNQIGVFGSEGIRFDKEKHTGSGSGITMRIANPRSKYFGTTKADIIKLKQLKRDVKSKKVEVPSDAPPVSHPDFWSFMQHKMSQRESRLPPTQQKSRR